MPTNITSKPFRTLRYAHALFRWLFLGVVVLILLDAFVLTYVRVTGHSMEPALTSGEPVFVCKACLLVHPANVGDVVVVRSESDPSLRLVKRVSAIPGSTVVYNFQTIVLKPDEYFLLGDNADQSVDSRAFGPVKKSQIIGVVP